MMPLDFFLKILDKGLLLLGIQSVAPGEQLEGHHSIDARDENQL